MGYDDSLDVFGVHGTGGTIGAFFTGVFATRAINPIFKDATGNPLPVGLVDGNGAQILNQLVGVGITIALAVIGSFILFKLVDVVFGVRVREEEEILGSTSAYTARMDTRSTLDWILPEPTLSEVSTLWSRISAMNAADQRACWRLCFSAVRLGIEAFAEFRHASACRRDWGHSSNGIPVMLLIERPQDS